MGNPRLVLCAFFVVAAGCVSDPGPAGDGSNYYTGDPPPAAGSDDTGTTDGSAATPPDDGDDDTGSDTGSDGGDTGGDDDTATIPEGLTAPPSCSSSYHDVYSPFPANTPAIVGPVSQYPWAAIDFSGWSPGHTIECGSNKSAVGFLDVTAGCLSDETFQQDARGQIHTTADNYYRSFALPTSNGTPVKWTDQSVEYDFYFSRYTGSVSNPGFKLFARYLDEYDLYVASFREDGTAQIQKKECGVYTTLKRVPNYGSPSFNQWHHIKFEAIGNDLRFYIDGQLAVQVHDTTFAAGAAGIRIDDTDGAYIDNWRVSAP
jgi:hypothetical protein